MTCDRLNVRDGEPPAQNRLRLTAIPWRDGNAPVALARALGEIAADLWLRDRVRLTPGHTVATIGTDEATRASAEDAGDQVPSDGGGCEAVA